MRSKLIDVAREAGVSSATVDRVLNDREGVRARTREIVLSAARRLGYISNGGDTLSDATSQDIVKLHFILPEGNNQFIRRLHEHLETLAKRRSAIDVTITATDTINADLLAQQLRDITPEIHGVGFVGIDHPNVRQATKSLADRGIKVVTLASDIHHVPRVAYIGIDNRAAGRLAGYLLKRFMPGNSVGKVALFAGSLSYRGHEEREMGFRHILAEETPDLKIVQLREMMDEPEKAYLEACSLFDTHPDLSAIYNIGAGNTGIARALKERSLDQKIIFLGHEIAQDTQELLLDGTIDAIIDQNPRVEAREALTILEHAVRNQPFEFHPPRLQVILRENIPDS